MMVDVTETCCY